MSHPMHRWRGIACLIASLALGGLAAGCGSNHDSTQPDSAATATTTSSTSESSSAVDATVKEFSAPVEWPGPEESVTPPVGKKITIITCGSQGITCVRVANGAKAAAEALGYEAKIVDGQSQPPVWNKAVSTAVSEKADGIVLAAVPPALVTGALDAAKKAHIPVASVLSVLGPPTDVRVNYDRAEVARANAAFIAKDSGGKASVLRVQDNEFPETIPTMKAIPSELKKLCECDIPKTVDFTLALAPQRLAGDVAQVLRSAPSINYIVVPFDGVVPFISQGIRQAGRTGKVKIVGVGADPPSIEAIKAGDEAMSLGTAAEWMGWDAMDGLARILAGKDVAQVDKNVVGGASNYVVPMRYVTAENLPGPEGWQGDFDYQAKFKQLWGK